MEDLNSQLDTGKITTTVAEQNAALIEQNAALTAEKAALELNQSEVIPTNFTVGYPYDKTLHGVHQIRIDPNYICEKCGNNIYEMFLSLKYIINMNRHQYLLACACSGGICMRYGIIAPFKTLNITK